MADKPEIGLRYCGGCNSRYDRVALVKRLESFFPEATFVGAEEGKSYPAVVVACGCSSRCANVSGLAVPMGRLIYLNGGEDLLPLGRKHGAVTSARQKRQREFVLQRGNGSADAGLCA